MWPTPRAPISSTRCRVCSSARSTVSGRPISLLSDPGARRSAPSRSSSCAMRSLVLVLPAEPVSATTVAPRRAHDVPGERAQRGLHVVHHDRGHADRAGGQHRDRAVRDRAGRRSRGRRPARRRRRRTALPGTTSGSPSTTGPVTRTAAVRYVVRAPADRVGDLGEGEGDHAAPVLLDRGAQRPLGRRRGGPLRRSPGPARGPCPLPARCRPARPAATAAATAAARSGSDDRRGRAARAGTATAPASIAARIASGSSERGLSEVSTAVSASRASAAPIGAALGRVPVAAAAQHGVDPAVVVLAQRPQHGLDGVGLCA